MLYRIVYMSGKTFHAGAVIIHLVKSLIASLKHSHNNKFVLIGSNKFFNIFFIVIKNRRNFISFKVGHHGGSPTGSMRCFEISSINYVASDKKYLLGV